MRSTPLHCIPFIKQAQRQLVIVSLKRLSLFSGFPATGYSLQQEQISLRKNQHNEIEIIHD